MLPKYQYIQRIEVHNELIEPYQQFLYKLVNAHKKLGLEKSWTVYEQALGVVRDSRTFIFIRAMDSWGELDSISTEDPLAKTMTDAYGEAESLQWMTLAQRAVKKIETSVISRIDGFSLESS